MKIGIYTPHLNTYGGGEKYICKIAEILSRENDVDFIVFEEPNIPQLERRLNVNLSKINLNRLEIPKLFDVLRYFAKIRAVSRATKDYDLFINQENYTAIPPYSQKNVYLCQAPPTNLNKMQRLSIKRIVKNFLSDYEFNTYDMIMVYSCFVKKWVKKYYKKKVEVLYPPIDTEQFHPLHKENIILSVGRFFVGRHNKKQLEMIRVFKELYSEKNILKDWEYHLIGGISNTANAKEYLKRCQEEARGYPIYFHINALFGKLKELYGKAKIFWHATGLGENESEYPERMEHFGITTGEAMSAGCVPIVINKGGQPEIVRHAIDGFLWNTTKELKEYTIKLINDENLWKEMSQASTKRIQYFDMSRFEERVKQIFAERLK